MTPQIEVFTFQEQAITVHYIRVDGHYDIQDAEGKRLGDVHKLKRRKWIAYGNGKVYVGRSRKEAVGKMLRDH